MINIEKTYTKSIEQLKNNENVVLKLKSENIPTLILEFNKALTNLDWQMLKKIIFIFQYSEKRYFDLNDTLNRAAKNLELPNELAIYILSLYSKHIFTPLQLDSLILSKPTIDALKVLATRESDEIFEWFLRAVESLDSRDLRHFKTLIENKRPNFFEKFKKVARINNELIDSVLNKLNG